MNTSVNDIFLAGTYDVCLSDAERAKKDIIIESVRAFSQCCVCQGVYVIDYSNRKFAYMSDKMASLCGHHADTMREMGYDFYRNYVPCQEYALLKEAHRKGFEFMERVPKEDRVHYSMQYDVHIINGRRTHCTHHTLTPLALDKKGHIWLALCIVTISSKNHYGHIIIKRENDGTFYEYDHHLHKWVGKSAVILTDMERSVLWMIRQGYTLTDMAEMLCRTTDTVKACRRRLYAKLGVVNMMEAMNHVEMYSLI